jgi:predicted transcriptional regulator
MSKLNGKIVKAVRVKNTDLGRVIGESLQKLRELAGLTQTQIAARLNVGQAAISKYVEALGATLRIFSSMKQHVTISTETRISPGEAYRSAN